MLNWINEQIGKAAFRYIQGKQSLSFPPIVAMLQAGRGVSTKRNLESFAKEGYGQNSTVYACVKEIAEAAAGIPILLYRQRGERVEEIENHPLLDLLERPNPLMDGFEFRVAVFSFLGITGNYYIERAGPERGAPRELYTLRPDRMKVLPHRFELVAGYEYTVNQEKIRFAREQVLHGKLFHPADDFYGLSPVEAAAYDIDVNSQGKRWNAALFDNMAVPSGMVVPKNDLSDEQHKKLYEDFREVFGGVRNARKWMVGSGDLKWEEMGTSPRDMDWEKAMTFSALQITQIYNVPPELVGLQPATYQNRREARKALYTETVCPLMKRHIDALNRWLVPLFGDDLYLEMNKDGIEALSEDLDSLWKRANESTDLSLNEKRRIKGYEDWQGGDVILVGLNSMPLEDIVSGGVPDEGAEDDLGGDDEEGEDEERAWCPRHMEEKEAVPEGKSFTPSERKRYRREFREVARLRERFQRRLLGRVRTAFDGDADAVSTAFESGGLEGALTEVARREKSAWLPMLERHHQDVLRAFGKRALDQAKSAAPEIETKQDEAEDLFASLVSQFAREHAAESVTKIGQTTGETLRRIVAEGLEGGLSNEEIASGIADAIGQDKAKRALVIARTETHAAQNTGQVEQIRALGRDDMLKGWLWSGVSRSEHAAIDGTWVGLYDKFSVGGVMMDRPGDPAGGAANVVNCSCTLVFKRE